MLTLICGIPNAGKTTYSQRFENVIHTDEIEPIGRSYVQGVYKILSEMDGDVCVEGTFLDKRGRGKLLDIYNGNARCIWLDTPLEECIRRENRGRGTLITRNCHACMQPPTLDEGWDEIIIIRGDDEQRISK